MASVCIVLHTHLPFVHHPDYDDFLEEDWLFEAILDCYLPILDMMRRLRDEGVGFRLAFSMTPSLVHMLENPSLRAKADRFIAGQCALVDAECEAYDEDDPRTRTAAFYRERFGRLLGVWQAIDGDIVGAWRELADAGVIEILASAATHGFLPLLRTPQSVDAQIRQGCELYERAFGRPARGFWLPECAYAPGLDEHLAAAGVEWTVLETHGVLGATPPPTSATFRPLELPSGVVAFGRERRSSEQVWSSEVGYPGDADYRELYRDVGFDGAYRRVRPFLKSDGIRRSLGIKYHRITGDVSLDAKDWYDHDKAAGRARVHAGNFLFNRSEQVHRWASTVEGEVVICTPYDTELFGHWWFEGPEFLEQMFRRAHDVGDDLPFSFRTPSEVLDRGGVRPRGRVGPCSWGAEGSFRVWLNEKNQWFWPYLHEMEERMVSRVRALKAPTDRERRILAQMGRELLLAQSSDWPFIITMETSAHYAERRFRDHVHRFFALEDVLDGAEFDENDLARVERDDCIFPDLDPGAWS